MQGHSKHLPKELEFEQISLMGKTNVIHSHSVVILLSLGEQGTVVWLNHESIMQVTT